MAANRAFGYSYCLGGPAAVNNGGNLNLQGSVDTGDLPAPYDDNSDPCTADGGMVGAKIWLVLADDVAITNKMVGWNPGEHLLEWDRITFEDADE